ncbi:unnamed protein product [Allacma fusca]|uniref:Uncharacterized protein n=1 Tax=Allacma fusca TaxID=39272 RepID=A0A8J2KGT0_9HEXA|nr:unnamed protein product [Allacma fusca]
MMLLENLWVIAEDILRVVLGPPCSLIQGDDCKYPVGFVSSVKDKPPIDDLERIVISFKDLLESFKLFGTVSEIYVLAILGETTTELFRAWCSIFMFTKHIGLNFSEGVAMSLNFFLIMNLGHYIESQKQQILNWILKWQWDLTAMGFFSINRRLLTGVATILTSYIIFVFQLKISGSPG